MISQQHAKIVLTSSKPAILVYSRVAIVLQGKPSHQYNWPPASNWPAARALAYTEAYLQLTMPSA